MKQVIGFAGEKQSGKSSAAQYVVGHIIDYYGVLPKDSNGNPGFGMAEQDGLLQILADGKWHLFDAMRPSGPFVEFAENYVQPIIQIHNLADALKDVAVGIFDLDERLVYGDDEEKSMATNITWDDIRFILAPREVSRLKKDNMLGENITVRQFLQYFGTDICRRIKDDCWVHALLTRLETKPALVSLVDDIRFPNENEALKEYGAKTIYFTRSKTKDKHKSERAFDGYDLDNFDAVIDNSELTLQEKNYKVIDLLYDWKVLPIPGLEKKEKIEDE